MFKVYGPRHYIAKIKELENQSLWQRLNSFAFLIKKENFAKLLRNKTHKKENFYQIIFNNFLDTPLFCHKSQIETVD